MCLVLLKRFSHAKTGSMRYLHDFYTKEMVKSLSEKRYSCWDEITIADISTEKYTDTQNSEKNNFFIKAYVTESEKSNWVVKHDYGFFDHE